MVCARRSCGRSVPPSLVVRIPYPCPNDIYEARVTQALARAKVEGIGAIIFGDPFLEDVRAYRLAKLAGTGIEPVFPLWHRPTGQLARDMIAGGLETYLSTVDLNKLPASFAGRKFDATLLADFPAGIDPCGENGELHSCVVAGPRFLRGGRG